MSSNPAADAVQGITETDIANYLAATPGFFERHAALLASVWLLFVRQYGLRWVLRSMFGRRVTA